VSEPAAAGGALPRTPSLSDCAEPEVPGSRYRFCGLIGATGYDAEATKWLGCVPFSSYCSTRGAWFSPVSIP